MKSLDSLKFHLYNKYNHSADELRNIFNNDIIKDTVVMVDEEHLHYDSLRVIMTDDYLFGIGKSIKKKEWNLVVIHSNSEMFFNEFGLNKHMMLSDIETIYDSTDSYKVGNEAGIINKFAISFPDTGDFIYFIEFVFYFQSDSLKAISFDVHENR